MTHERPDPDSHLLEIDSSSDEAYDAPREWRKRAKGVMICTDCGCVNRNWIGKPCDVVLNTRPRTVATIAECAGLLQTELMEMLRPHFPEVYVGRCFVQKDHGTELVGTHVTCYVPMESELLVRWNRWKDGDQYRVCRGCGRVHASAVAEPCYTLRRYLDERQVYLDSAGCLYMTPALVNQLDLRRHFRDLRLTRLPVLDRPLDGLRLPGDPEWT